MLHQCQAVVGKRPKIATSWAFALDTHAAQLYTTEVKFGRYLFPFGAITIEPERVSLGR